MRAGFLSIFALILAACCVATAPESRPATQPATQPSGLDLIPLTELGAAKYKDQTGGLYGDGANNPPAAQVAAAIAQLQKIQPLDADGKPAADGKIVFISIGMSNTSLEFDQFKTQADADPAKNASVTIVDGAQSGADARYWADPGKDGRGGDECWATLDQRLQRAGVGPKQVQVAWLKQALSHPGRLGEFPKHVHELQTDLRRLVGIARKRYPNLAIVYLSSRSYGGYAATDLSPEPYAYESAFAVRGVILEQIGGAAELNFDPAKGAVVAPLLLWGPYLWAAGPNPRKIDHLTWEREDFFKDGIRPAQPGSQKVADLLLDFFKTSPLARSWFTGH